ncbi:MAG: NADH-quinone oxidoreductase subunit F, partial [Firmicutes bacterium]|nr:NADH-quinone oxidoreductase subunit F [Bacillota bacterium]
MKVIIGQGSCGIATGAKKTESEFAKLIKEDKLKVDLGITGCVGMCYLEPIVDVYEDNGEFTRYVQVQTENVKTIVDSHLKGGKVAEELVMKEEDASFLGQQKRVVLRNAGSIDPENIDEYIAVDG